MDGKFEEDILVLTKESWHGKEDMIIPRGTTVDEACEIARLDEVVWTTKPLYVEVEPGRFMRFGNKDGLVRLPNRFADDYHCIDTRTVRDYEIVSNEFLMDLAKDLAHRTGWTIEGLGTLRHNEITFIQLRLDRDYCVADLPRERHRVRLLYGDDKAYGSGFTGLEYTRVECLNTFMFAISESGIAKISHRDSPEARWKLINAESIAIVKAFTNQNLILDQMFRHSLTDPEFEEWLALTFPEPKASTAMLEAKKARKLIDDDKTNGYDLSEILERGAQSSKRYMSEIALIEKRRAAVRDAYFNRYSNEVWHSTYYAALQALTYVANHSDVYRGNAEIGVRFGGKRSQDIKKGYDVLLDWLGLS